MAHSKLPDVLPEELAALDELARLLERYQTYLIAGHGFADSARAQAGSASGTARPALKRLNPAAVAQVDAALRLLRTEEDRATVLEDLEPALQDLRALLATAKWRVHDTPVGAAPRAMSEAMRNPVGDPVANPLRSASVSAPTASRSRAWIWVGGGLIVGLILGAFGTDLTRSASALSRVWILLEPVIAAGSGGMLGNLLFQSNTRDLKETVRKHWIALLVCSVLLLSTVPTAVEAAKELFGMGTSHSSAESSAPAPANTSSQPSPAPAPANPPSLEQPAAAAAGSPSSQSSVADAPSSPSPAARPGVPPPTQGKETPRTNRSSPAAPSDKECTELLARLSLGDKSTLTAREQALLQQCK